MTTIHDTFTALTESAAALLMQEDALIAAHDDGTFLVVFPEGTTIQTGKRHAATYYVLPCGAQLEDAMGDGGTLDSSYDSIDEDDEHNWAGHARSCGCMSCLY